MKLILGLMWTLILHYSISMPMWDGDEFGGAPPTDQTPKQRLLNWIQSRIPDKPIHNFTTDWNDGTAVGALVDAVAPGYSRFLFTMFGGLLTRDGIMLRQSQFES